MIFKIKINNSSFTGWTISLILNIGVGLWKERYKEETTGIEGITYTFVFFFLRITYNKFLL